MKKIEIDLKNIDNKHELYRILALKLDFPDYFGNNLDALWDMLTGYVEYPIEINLIGYKDNLDQDILKIVDLLKEVQDENNDDFIVRIV